MFYGASAFNQAVESWDTSQVPQMGYMFEGASAFNQAVGSWDTSQVQYMYGMFYDASAFNQDLCQWRSAFPYNNADDIFVNSGCANQATPVDANGGENWCAETTCN
jgi:surface protein